MLSMKMYKEPQKLRRLRRLLKMILLSMILPQNHSAFLVLFWLRLCRARNFAFLAILCGEYSPPPAVENDFAKTTCGAGPFCDTDNSLMNFTAIDFETATGYRSSACAVGIVTVENGEITETYYSLIQPPGNQYWIGNIEIHGIRPKDTSSAPTFGELYPEIRKRLAGRTLVAHNASFDRSVLGKTMEHYGLDGSELNLTGWECTLRIYRSKGFHPCKLSDCCGRLGIELNHHEALSDALACARLYLMR
jgi:DNA polymerase-3 subunit epsilon